jgi:hypothetical protein
MGRERRHDRHRRTHVKGQDGQRSDGGPELRERDLERRVAELEKQVVTLAAAVDAASRMRVATPYRLHQDVRIAGGRLVRRILEKGRLVEPYGATRRTGQPTAPPG